MRFRSKHLAALSIILVLASAAGAWHQPDDADEFIRVVHSGSGGKRVDDAKPPVAPEHCALCHWLRAFGSAAPIGAHVVSPSIFSRLIASGADSGSDARTALAITSRGPPAI